MADSSENILVEFDYNNIAVIDPNKILDDNGRAKERLVKHEELVMYVNLECKVIPRTKMLIGASNSDNIRTISVSSMNFLNPGKKTFLDNSYTDELTGKDTLIGEGVNQQNIQKTQKPGKTDEYYFEQTTKSGKDFKSTDNGLLGMKSISIKQGLDFEPVINIKLEDVKGRALFESGNDSPYSAFFNLPYPLFYLTVKGYYGKAIRLPLMLQDFNSSYNSNTGNFEIDLLMYTYKYTILSEITVGALAATPHMYRSNIQVSPKTSTVTAKKQVNTEYVEYGYQKVQEMYSEYKSKGLIPDDFPELTLVQMKNNLDNFIKNVLENFPQANLDPLTNLSRYKEKLGEYRGKVFYYDDSWFNTYMDVKNPYILSIGKSKIYQFLPSFTAKQKADNVTALKAIITEYNSILDKNETCGASGSYNVEGRDVPCSINNKVEFKIIEIEDINEEDIDFEETFKAIKGDVQPTTTDIDELRLKFQESNKTGADVKNEDGSLTPVKKYYKFEGKKSFIDVTNKMAQEVKVKTDEIETALANVLASLLKSKNNSLGFIPTIRNVLAVIFANGEAFIRMMDEVHVRAWNERDSPIRKAAIFSTNTSSANPDVNKENDKAKIPVYPWPSFIIETDGENGNEKYQPKYPGDSDVIEQTKADLYDQWPEVEFVEEFSRGLSVRLEPTAKAPVENKVSDVKRLSVNAIEFPTNNEIYDNKEETKFFYEIYERLILSSFYSKMSRTTNDTSDLNRISDVVSEIEKTNIIESIATESPFLRQKLTNYPFTANNYLSVLRSFSNEGVGDSWQNFLRGIFNSPYIKNATENASFLILNLDSFSNIFNQSVNVEDITTTVSLENQEKLSDYITASTKSNVFDFTDTYPFVDNKWTKNSLAGKNPLPPEVSNFLNIPTPFTSNKEIFDTTKILFYNNTFKVISNFSGTTLSVNDNGPKPFSGYNFKKLVTPSTGPQNAQQPEINLNDLEKFYENRRNNYNVQLPTEGNLNYSSKAGLLAKNQTISIMNTPYFVNSVQQGVKKFRNFDPNPYTVPAYLFLNSLPLSTLREKYTTFSVSTPPNSTQEQQSTEYLNYIFATFKKYGAIHKLPLAWVLKLGSVWHRYKKWVQTGTDILDDCWRQFPYVENFDPITSASTFDYSLTLANNQNVDIILEKETTIGSETFTQINTGFYPQMINDFNVFYQGFRLFTGYTNSDVQEAIYSGLTLVNTSDSNIAMGFSGDPSNPNRIIQINPWSVYVKKLSNDQFSFILPSHGTSINQVRNECFQNDTLKIEVVGNQSIYNGSVRSFWSAPNYGYFDPTKILKPTPDEYMKQVFGGFLTQQNFSLNGTNGKYTKISEMFSVFEKQALDVFEEKFLSFSKSKYDYADLVVEQNQSSQNFGNFQLMMSALMQVPTPDSGQTPTQVINQLQLGQMSNFASYLKSFMDAVVVMKYGNPSNFDKNLFFSFSNKIIVDPFVFEKYTVLTPNALPSSTGTQTLVGSKISYSGEWETLLEYVGFSELPGIEYSNTGSTIFDFFIDNNIAFTSQNIKVCSPIIKIYATQKYLNPNMNRFDFSKKMDGYIDDCTKFINESLNKTFKKVSGNLEKVTIKKDKQKLESLTGRQTKLELYESFKATNDKWISGNDYKTKTLFEDVLLLDRASRDIGNRVVVDIYKLRALIDIETLDLRTSMLVLVQSILKDNNFVVMNIPAYINFYGIQDVSKNAIPKPEGSLELANTLFGTFLNVDYRESSTKMVCFYGGKKSEHLDAVEAYKNDSFNLRRASDNPLVENPANKSDHALSNKVVGFNVDVGPQNQGIFTTFSVSQKNSTPTAESLQLISQMASQGGNRSVATQSLSLYNLYKVRSYDCSVTMMGNSLIQPMMYFNLRYVPMFSGPYMILEVSHSISPGQFITSFTGVRQPIASYRIDVDFVQSLRTNLLQQIIDKKQQEVEAQKAEKNNNILSNKDSVVSDSLDTTNSSQSSNCSGATQYSSYTKLEAQNPKSTVLTFSNAKKSVINMTKDIPLASLSLTKLRYAIFAQLYLQSGTANGFVGLENNYSGVDISKYWGDGNSTAYFSNTRQFFCVKKGKKVLPYVVFDNIDDNVGLFASRWRQRMGNISQPIPEDIAKFVTTNNKPNALPESTWDSLGKTDKDNIISKVKKSMDIYDQTVVPN